MGEEHEEEYEDEGERAKQLFGSPKQPSENSERSPVLAQSDYGVS